ncbi:hypothetical protein EHN06_11785 [Marinobacter sp. NP-4(2019)]|uniref:hypothetical protein n=1 Tax=Marinobacter sp. NP-4(2019) TaxID=2488665 RepID=UPI000FC3CFF2|nr:hypothetical protein [Marinobacter sp. NP-4(2019)]AZT84162.1 hypothetical protein EHN06_11785 [Marinobacter sp. NP-4(2019)]
MENTSSAQVSLPQASHDTDVVNYRYLALGLLSARVYTEESLELIEECVVLDFDRDGVALILSGDQVKPDENVRLSLVRKLEVRNPRDEPVISFVPGNVRYVNDIGDGVRVGIRLDYSLSQELDGAFRHRAIEVENYLERHHADAARMASSVYRIPEGYEIGGRMKYAS